MLGVGGGGCCENYFLGAFLEAKVSEFFRIFFKGAIFVWNLLGVAGGVSGE